MNKKPPVIPRTLFTLLIRSENRQSLLSNVDEEFAELVSTRGFWRARIWYWFQWFISLAAALRYIWIQQFYRPTIWGGMMFKSYLKTTLRNIRKNKAYSSINIIGLAVGMACCILILLWVQDELSYDRYHENLDQLHRIVISGEKGAFVSSPWALLDVLKKDYPEIVGGSWYFPRSSITQYNNHVFYDDWALVHPDFLRMFTFPFIQGNPETALNDKSAVVITARTAEKYFGNADPLGKIITFDNRTDLTVTGVIEDVPSNSSFRFDLLAHPSVYMGDARLLTWSMDCPSFIMLHSEADHAEVEDKIVDTINDRDQRTSHIYYTHLQPVKRMHLYAVRGTDPVMYVILFTSVAVIVLLIACINFMNLSTARSATRAKEVGLRKVVGAERRDIIRQFFGESLVLTFIALIIAVLMVSLTLPSFNMLAAKQLSLNLIQNPTIIMGLIVIALITGIISGSYPALYLSSFRPVSIMKSIFTKNTKGGSLRRGLIIFQFTAAIILIASTLVIRKQMNYIRTTDLGFDREQILTIRTNREFRSKYDVIKQSLLESSDIVNVSAASSLPLNVTNNNPVYWEGRGPEDYESINFVCCDYDYFEIFDMEMAHGRSFSREHPTDKENYIINEAALRLTGYEDPIGRMYSMWTAEGQIIGVVKNFHATSLHNDIRPIVFVMYQNLPYMNMFAKIRTTEIPQTIDFIERTIENIVPNFLFRYEFLDDVFDRQYQREQRLADILEAFMVLAIFISCLGLLGLAAFMAERRTKEVAVRKVLGAGHANIVSILSREFIVLIAVASAVAWPVSYFAMTKWMQGFAFHTSIGFGIFLISGIAALVIAQGTVSYQALKAARINPADSLKYE